MNGTKEKSLKSTGKRINLCPSPEQVNRWEKAAAEDKLPLPAWIKQQIDLICDAKEKGEPLKEDF